MHKAFAALLLAPLIGSCQAPDIVAAAAFIGDSLVFVAADPGDAEAEGCWTQGTVIDDRLRPVWQFSGPGTGTCERLFPIVYGRAPSGTQASLPARRLDPGRLYLFMGDVTGNLSGAFALTRAGDRMIVHNVDPDSPAAAALRQRWRQSP